MNCATRGWPRNTWQALLFVIVCLVSVKPTQAQDAPDPVKAISNFFSRIIAPVNTSATAAEKPVEPTTSTRAVDGSNATSGETRNLTVSSTGKRLALIIGNDNYQKVSKLQKAGNDATAMARELKVAGFDTTLHKDLNYQDMVRAIETFSNRINGGDQVVVFFAGHGVQIKTGSYLLPVDIEASSESQVERTAYGVADLTDKLNEAKASFALVMVDACRDNPLKTNGRNVGNNRGLSAIEPPKGQMVVYSASKGQQALDRLDNSDNNPNGIFTREFIKRMKKPGVKIQDLMIEVQDSVEMLAQTVHHEQRPAIYNESRGNFYFFGPTTVQLQGGNLGADPESETWTAAERSNSAMGYQAYLDGYPKGRYQIAAKIALDTLKQLAPTPIANAAPSRPAPVASARPDDAETAFWNEVKSSASREYLDAYIKQYPKGKYLALAKLELRKLDDKEQAERGRQAAQRSQDEQIAWDGAKSADTIGAYESYLNGNPNGRYVALAQLALQKFKRLAEEQKNDVSQIEAANWKRLIEAASGPTVIQEYFDKNPGKIDALMAAGQRGDGEAQAQLAQIFLNGWGVARNLVEGVKWASSASELGSSSGQTSLGLAFINGQGVAKDDAKGLMLLRKAAEQGYAKGQANLGVAYELGNGVPKDEAEAVKWYRKAADQGNVIGQDNLGLAYANGMGLSKDEAEAVKWFRKSAEQGGPYGQNSLGYAYANGLGVSKNEVEGVKWFRKAAEQGHAGGQNNLGLAYVNGKGVSKDDAEAVKWFRKATEQGDAIGQNNFGVLHEYGIGVSKDEAEAVKWYRKSAEQGYATAKSNLKRLGKS